MCPPPQYGPINKYFSIPHYLSQCTSMSNYSFLGILEVPEPGYTQFTVGRYGGGGGAGMINYKNIDSISLFILYHPGKPQMFTLIWCKIY